MATLATRTAAFTNALLRIGFNQPTVNAVNAEGFATVTDLLAISEEQIKAMIKHIGSWQERIAPVAPAAGAAAPPAVNFPFLVVQRLKAFWYWASLRKRQGTALNAIDAEEFTEDIWVTTMQRIQEESQIKSALEDQTPTKPTKLGWDLLLWPKFWEQLKTYLSQCRGAACIPLVYLVCEHDAILPEMHDMGLYDSVDNYMMATAMLSGDHYKIDNTRLYNNLKPLVIEGAGWAFIKKFDRSKNGRGALMALKRQAEGTSAKRTRKARAYASLAQAWYRGEHRNFEFGNYVQIHQDAHNEELDLEEPVPETKKVQDFLSGILDARLQTGKDIVLGTPLYLQDFKECQQYLSTLVSNTSTQAKNDRHIGAAHRTDHDDDDGGPPKKRFKKAKPQRDVNKKGGAVDLSKHKPKKPLTDRSYSNNEWKAMEDKQQAEVRALSDAKKPGTGHKMGSITSITDEPPVAEVVTKETKDKDNGRKGGNAGNQFGCRAHMSEKPIEDPDADPDDK
jgi:hypothetical protein